jgi:ribonuclease E
MLDNDADSNSTSDSTGSTGSTGSTVPAVPPKRIRVSALAKELGVTSKELLALIADIGEVAKTASSALDQAVADRVRAAADRDQPTEDAGDAPMAPAVVFVAPTAEPAKASSASRRRRRGSSAPAGPPTASAAQPAAQGPDVVVAEDAEDQTAEPEDVREAAEAEAAGAARRRRRRGRRGRGGASKPAIEADAEATVAADDPAPDATAVDAGEPAEKSDESADGADAADNETDSADGSAGTRRRRRRRRSSTSGGSADAASDDPPNTVTHVRETSRAKTKNSDDGVKGVKGSTRLEARRQRRRDGRDTNRRRPPILTEAEFLARRESVDRVMAVRQRGDRTQIAVLEDGILVEHYVTRASATSYVGNVYLGRVQNVLPSMEAAFVDIGKGRNGVLYAGEVNWDAAGLEGKSRAIEQALKSGDAVLVQVTKDPIGHKGARLTSQISLPGRFLVYVPGGGMTGISRRLPDTERHRLKAVLKKIVPEDAGVIVRTAAEGASEADLTRDIERLQAEWSDISKKAAKPSSAPALVHGEPDLAIRVVRDVFSEDFNKLVVQGDAAWKTVSRYINGVAPDLAERVEHHTAEGDLFADLRVDEQIMKALDRKVWLPSGGSLIIDRTEAMTVIDVNTGKFVGAGGNLEQTVTRNNLEAAEEIVRQLRLRDVGGIVVIDFIDMVLESNRELVLRRLTECLGRDRTKHQVAEVTSLGLVQMTRKRVGEGLLEAFSETCEVCHGRGVIIHTEPVDRPSTGSPDDDNGTGGRSRSRRKGKRVDADAAHVSTEQRSKALEAMSAVHRAAHSDADDESVAELELDAVTAVLSGADVDASALAAETLGASKLPDGAPVELPQAAEDELVAEAVETAEGAQAPVAKARKARPRRRRAASRPAGPPAVNE